MASVVDASALVYATTELESDARRLRRRMVEDACHAPHIIDAELGNVLRRRVQRRELGASHGAGVLASAPLLIDHRYEARGALADAAWALRDNLTFYDALYASLAAGLTLVLLTTNGRLAKSPGLPCQVELVA